MEIEILISQIREKLAIRPDVPYPHDWKGSPPLPDMLRDIRAGKKFAPSPIPPPASPEEISKAEELIGFELPPLLKSLYCAIGNGGFGPGYGLLPLFTPPRRHGRGEGAIDLYLLFREGDLVEEGFSWAPMLIPILDWGSAVRSCVDCSNPDLPIMRDSPKLEGHPICEAESMQEWLTDWLDGKDLFSKG